MVSIYLNIGSNTGDRLSHIERAVALIADRWPESRIRRAPLFHSEPWGFESPNRFVNLGLAVDFDLESIPERPEDILKSLREIEKTIAPDSPHRDQDGHYIDRAVDIDIIDIDGITLNTPELTIPHPRAEARDFVMKPMAFLAPGWYPRRSSEATHAKKTIADMNRVSVETFREIDKIPLTIVVDNVRSMGNIGSLFRTSDAFTVEEIILCGISATPPAQEIHKTALGAEDSVAWRYFESTAEAVDDLRRRGYRVGCLEQVHGSILLNDFVVEPSTKYALVVGNEVNGVDQAIVDTMDFWLEIPQGGTKHSLNVTVSAAIAIWHFFSHQSPNQSNV